MTKIRIKKIAITFVFTTLLFVLAGCNTNSKDADDNKGRKNVEGELEDILNTIYETADLDDNFKEFVKDGLQLTEINQENVIYHLGTEISFQRGIVSEPMITSSAYALALIRAEEDGDVEEIKKDIKENVNPAKWICVGVDPSNVIVDNIGDLVILIMSDDNAKALHEAFLALNR